MHKVAYTIVLNKKPDRQSLISPISLINFFKISHGEH